MGILKDLQDFFTSKTKEYTSKLDFDVISEPKEIEKVKVIPAKEEQLEQQPFNELEKQQYREAEQADFDAKMSVYEESVYEQQKKEKEFLDKYDREVFQDQTANDIITKKEEYKEAVMQAKDFLLGKTDAVQRQIAEKMKQPKLLAYIGTQALANTQQPQGFQVQLP